MSNKPSPQDSEGSEGQSHGSFSSPRSRSHSEDLVIRKQPPSHVYADEWFEIEVNLEFTRGRGASTRRISEGEAEFVPSLCQTVSGLPVDDGSTITSSPTSVRFSLSETPPRRKRKLRCKITTVVQPQKDKALSYVVKLAPAPNAESAVANIAPVSTRHVFIVNYKLQVSVDDSWDSTFYKDEGGRDKCMTATVGLYARGNQPIKGAAIPLSLALCYDANEHPVPVRVNKQEILRVLGPDQPLLNATSGRTKIRFRIEDVSKNHQGQDFRVEVAPSDKAKGFKDVGPGYTPAVSVRSKRNKRQRSITASARSDEARSQQRIQSPTHLETSSRQGFPGDTVGSTTESPFAGANIRVLREAMKGVIQWTEEVVNGLYPLQWQVIGYAQHPDGSPDYNRPYHNMPNPNPYIQRVLSMYSGVTRDHLRVILSAIEQASPSHHRDDSFQSSTSSLREPQEHFSFHPGASPPGLQAPPGYPGLPVQSAAGPYGPGVQYAPPPDMFRPDMGPATLGHSRASPVPPHSLFGPPQAQRMPPLAEGVSRQSGAASLQEEPRHGDTLPQDQERRLSSPLSEVAGVGAEFERDSEESEVAYVLARQFKAVRTGERLGFPAYDGSKELVGFYSESTQKVGVGQFVHISQYANDFGPLQMMESTEVLEEAIAKKSDEVYALKDWGSISNLIDHALVYAWSKDIDPGQGNTGSSSGGSGGD